MMYNWLPSRYKQTICWDDSCKLDSCIYFSFATQIFLRFFFNYLIAAGALCAVCTYFTLLWKIEFYGKLQYATIIFFETMKTCRFLWKQFTTPSIQTFQLIRKLKTVLSKVGISSFHATSWISFKKRKKLIHQQPLLHYG